MSGRPKKNELERREVLLKAALSVFIEKGVSAASVDSLADSAGVSKATFYRYFKDKHDLFEQSLHSFIESQRILLPELNHSQPDDSELEVFAQSLLKTLCSKKSLAVFRAVIGESSTSPNVGSYFYSSITNHGVDVLTKYFEFVLEKPLEEARVKAFQFLGCLKEQCFWPSLFTGRFPPQSEIKNVISEALHLHRT